MVVTMPRLYVTSRIEAENGSNHSSAWVERRPRGDRTLGACHYLGGRRPAVDSDAAGTRPKRWRKSYRLGSGLMQALELLAGINRARPMARRFSKLGPRAVSLFCVDYENRDERAEDQDGLETDRAYDPF